MKVIKNIKEVIRGIKDIERCSLLIKKSGMIKKHPSKLAEELSRKNIIYTPVEIDRVIDNIKNLKPGISENDIRRLCTEICTMANRMGISLQEAVHKITKMIEGMI